MLEIMWKKPCEICVKTLNRLQIWMPNSSCVVDLVKEQQNKKRYRVPYFNDSLITVVKFTAVLKLKSSEKLMVADRCTLNLITGNRTFLL